VLLLLSSPERRRYLVAAVSLEPLRVRCKLVPVQVKMASSGDPRARLQVSTSAINKRNPGAPRRLIACVLCSVPSISFGPIEQLGAQ
jgi:hypothetical protein